jgi:hypothetical protein
MTSGAWMMMVALVLALAALCVVMYALVRSIVVERTAGRSVWREFSLGLLLMVLFVGTWVSHGIAEWQVFTDEQRSHGETTDVGDFVSEFSQATLENWQSEFLQLSALFIHKGSAESKDSDEKIEAALRRIEEHLGTLPPEAPQGAGEDWKLPDTPIDLEAQPDR